MTRTKSTRRRWLRMITSTSGCVFISPSLLAATDDFKLAYENLLGTTHIRAEDRIQIKLPALAENGNSVRISVDVEHEMNAADYVRSITILAEANPLPEIIHCEFSPLAGRAGFETRIRVAAEQNIMVVAKLADDTAYTSAAHIVVTEAACLEALI